MWRRGVVVITTAQFHSTKPEIMFCAGSNPSCGVLEIRGGEDLWQWSRLEIRINASRRSTIPKSNLSSSSSSIHRNGCKCICSQVLSRIFFTRQAEVIYDRVICFFTISLSHPKTQTFSLFSHFFNIILAQ